MGIKHSVSFDKIRKLIDRIEDWTFSRGTPADCEMYQGYLDSGNIKITLGKYLRDKENYIKIEYRGRVIECYNAYQDLPEFGEIFEQIDNKVCKKGRKVLEQIIGKQ